MAGRPDDAQFLLPPGYRQTVFAREGDGGSTDEWDQNTLNETGPQAQKIADQLASVWVSFAATGDPNNARIPHWPAYKVPERATMVFGGGETVTVNGEEKPLSWLLTQLAKCTDQMPSSVAIVLDLDDGATYAQAVRAIRGRQRKKVKRR